MNTITLFFLTLTLSCVMVFTSCTENGTQLKNTLSDSSIHQSSTNSIISSSHEALSSRNQFISGAITKSSSDQLTSTLSSVSTQNIQSSNQESTDTPSPIYTSWNLDTIHVSTVEELQQLNRELEEGNKLVLLKPGTYTLSQTLWWKGDSNVIKGGTSDRTETVITGNFIIGNAFGIQGSNFVFENISIGEVNNHGIQIHGELDAHYLHVNNVRFFDIHEQMIKGSKSVFGDEANEEGSNYGIVEHSLFEFTNGKAYQYYTGGIDIHHGNGWIVRNNIFRNINNPGGGITEGAIHFWSNSSQTLIEKNIIYNCDRGILLGMDNSPHFGATIRNNFIVPMLDVGIYLAEARDVLVYNNTIYNTSNYKNSIEYRFTTTGTEIKNNLTNKNISSRNGGEALVEKNTIAAESHWFVDVENGDLHLTKSITTLAAQSKTIEQFNEDIDGDSRDNGKNAVGADAY